MTDLDDLNVMNATTQANPGAPKPRTCRRHVWVWCSRLDMGDRRLIVDFQECDRCGKVKDEAVTRRNRNNRARGNSDELAVATLLGGRKVGPLGLPWDVEVAGYARVQCKRLDRWPSLARVVEWLDAIPAGPELRAVTLADTPGAGRRTRRLIVLDLEEFAGWHGRKGAA